MKKYTPKKIAIKNVKFGQNVTVVEPANLYDCTIGDESFIGPFVEIQKDVKIGKNCKIQSHAFICSLVTLGDDCFVGHGVVFINVLFKDGKLVGSDIKKYQATQIGNHVIIGSNATILPVKICDHVVIGAGAVVTKDIIKSGIYAGNPARFLRKL